MKPIEKTSDDLFQKLRSRFSPVNLGDEEANSTNDPQKARFFNFIYSEYNKAVGNVTISIVNNRSLKLFYSSDLVEKVKNKDLWYKFLKEIREFSKRNLLAFDARDLAKSQLEKQDYDFLKTIDGTIKEKDVTVSESTMFGSRRKSYQTMENVKMIVHHRKSIDETVPGSRSRYIESIFLERADGERYKFPYNYLTGARAMAEHISHGGTPYDDMGKYIIGMIKEMRDLSKFARRTKKISELNEQAGTIRSHVVERFRSLKKQLGAMTMKEGYTRFTENFNSQETLAEDGDIEQIKERFTQQVFDTQLEDTLPAVIKAIKEAEMRQVAEADNSIENLVRTKELVLRKDDAADQMFRSTKFTDGAGLLGFILSDIASRAIGDSADEIANFASDAAERLQDRDYDPKDKQTAMMLAKKYMDDVKKMISNPSYADQIRIDPKEAYGAKKKRTGGFHEAEAYEAWANDLVPEANNYYQDAKDSDQVAELILSYVELKRPNLLKKYGEDQILDHAREIADMYAPIYKVSMDDLMFWASEVQTGLKVNGKLPESNIKKNFEVDEAGTQGTIGTQGTQAPANVGQAMRDPKLQQAAKNISRVAQAAGIKAPPQKIAQGMAAQATGRNPPRDTAMTTFGLGNAIQSAAANDPRKAAQLTAMMKKMVTQGKFDESAVREFLEQNLSEAPASSVINDPATKTSTAFKVPGSTPAQPKGMQQWLYGTGQNQNPSGSSTVKPVTPMPQFDKTQSAMPDMDAMVSREKATVTPTAPMISKDPAVAKALAAKGFDPSGKKITAIPNQAGAARANIPVGSMPGAKIPSIPANTGAARANIPAGSMPASTGYTVKAGDNLSKILTGKGMAATPDNIAKIAKLSGIKDPNMIKPGQTIKFN